MDCKTSMIGTIMISANRFFAAKAPIKKVAITAKTMAVNIRKTLRPA